MKFVILKLLATRVNSEAIKILSSHFTQQHELFEAITFMGLYT